MASLIENVVSLEQEADAVVAAAHAEAKEIEKRSVEELAARRAALESDAAARVEAFRQAAEARYAEELAEAEREFEAASSALRRLDAKAVERQADRVVARFGER